MNLANTLTGTRSSTTFSGPFWEGLVPGDSDGLHVTRFTNKGLAELFKTPHGGVSPATRATTVFEDRFDGEEFSAARL